MKNTKSNSYLMRRIIKLILLLTLFAYAGVCLFYFFYQETIIFPKHLVYAHSPQEIKKYETNVLVDGKKIHGWVAIHDTTKPVIFYYGGNSEVMGKSVMRYFRHLGSDTNIVAFEYPGYGSSEGVVSEKSFIKSMSVVSEQIINKNKIKPNRIVLIGRSMGSSVATQLAETIKPAGVILITPFDSIKAIGHARYPFLPLGLLLRHPFDSEAVASKLDVPVLVVEAEKDSVVPIKHAETLIKSWKGPVKKLFLHEGTHSNVYKYPALWSQMQEFITKVTSAK